ncbi:unnamed protein product, partial [Phaeothamnion confervicola]
TSGGGGGGTDNGEDSAISDGSGRNTYNDAEAAWPQHLLREGLDAAPEYLRYRAVLAAEAPTNDERLHRGLAKIQHLDLCLAQQARRAEIISAIRKDADATEAAAAAEAAAEITADTAGKTAGKSAAGVSARRSSERIAHNARDKDGVSGSTQQQLQPRSARSEAGSSGTADAMSAASSSRSSKRRAFVTQKYCAGSSSSTKSSRVDHRHGCGGGDIVAMSSARSGRSVSARSWPSISEPASTARDLPDDDDDAAAFAGPEEESSASALSGRQTGADGTRLTAAAGDGGGGGGEEYVREDAKPEGEEWTTRLVEEGVEDAGGVWLTISAYVGADDAARLGEIDRQLEALARQRAVESASKVAAS